MAEKVYDIAQTRAANEAQAKMGLPVYDEVLSEESKSPMELQEKFLMQLLRDNEGTEIGKKYAFSEMKNIADFRSRMPVTTYDDYAEQIERMKLGEKDVLISYPCDHMNTTSGTVGLPKAIPMSAKQTEVFLKYNFKYMQGLYAKNLGEEIFGGRCFCTAEGTYEKLPSGITVGCASGKASEYIEGGSGALDNMMRLQYTSPIEATSPAPGTDSKYIHLRFALADGNITSIVTGFVNQLCHMLSYLAANYELFINDIEKGTIDPEIRMPEEVRESLMKKIVPMPERAAELREIFKNGADFPFVPLVWPKLKYIVGAGGGGLAIYDDKLREHFTDGKVARVYSGISASEGLWSVPVKPGVHGAMLAASSAFMEFLPVEAGDDFSQAKLMDELEVGKIYELIITNLNGFYRYRMSDAVEVVGFIEKTPLVEFRYRVNKTISVMMEKTTEMALDQSATKAAADLGYELSDYAVYPDGDSIPGRYIFLMEPIAPCFGEDSPEKAAEKLKETVAKELYIANPRYKAALDKGNLAAPEVRILQPETAILYRDMMIYGGASASQLKPVHVISNEKQRKFFFALTE